MVKNLLAIAIVIALPLPPFLPATRRREIFRQENLATFVFSVRGAAAPFQNFVLRADRLSSCGISVQRKRIYRTRKPLIPHRLPITGSPIPAPPPPRQTNISLWCSRRLIISRQALVPIQRLPMKEAVATPFLKTLRSLCGVVLGVL